MEPKWLLWARELQAMAQTGLAFTKNAYDCQRYERLRELAAQKMAEHAGVEASGVENLFSEQVGYATPKVDVRGAVFKEGRVLLVRERSDEGRWALSGGWADVNRSPRECVVTEVREEAGLRISDAQEIADAHILIDNTTSRKIFAKCRTRQRDTKAGLHFGVVLL